MSVGSQIKKAREALFITQRELASLLDLSPSAIANYESNISYPKGNVLTKMFSVLKVDANFIFYDNIEQDNGIILTTEEETDIKKVRALDAHGKELVSNVIDLEYKRVSALK